MVATILRAKAKDALAYFERVGVQFVDAIKGFRTVLNQGDILTLGEVFLTSLSKEVLALEDLVVEGEDGAKSPVKGLFWVAETQVTRGNAHLTMDVPAGAFCRCAGAYQYPSRADKVRKTATSSTEVANLSNQELFEHLMERAHLTDEQKTFNRDLARAEGGLAKLQRLEDKTLIILAKSEAVYTLKFNSRREENWGSKPEHWVCTNVLFFEEDKTAKSSGKGKGKSK